MSKEDNHDKNNFIPGKIYFLKNEQKNNSFLCMNVWGYQMECLRNYLKNNNSFIFLKKNKTLGLQHEIRFLYEMLGGKEKYTFSLMTQSSKVFEELFNK